MSQIFPPINQLGTSLKERNIHDIKFFLPNMRNLNRKRESLCAKLEAVLKLENRPREGSLKEHLYRKR